VIRVRLLADDLIRSIGRWACRHAYRLHVRQIRESYRSRCALPMIHIKQFVMHFSSH